MRPDYSENQEIINKIIKSECPKFKSKCLKTLKTLSRQRILKYSQHIPILEVSIEQTRKQCYMGPEIAVNKDV